MMATPSSSLKDYESHKNLPNIASLPPSKNKRRTSFFWSCISVVASRCLKRFHSSNRPMEGIFHVIHDLPDKRFARVNLIIKDQCKFWYEMIPAESSYATVKPQRMEIPYIPGYSISAMISHLGNCEAVNRAGRIHFIENHHTWTIKRQFKDVEPYTKAVIHLVQDRTELYYRFLNGSELIYKKIEFDHDLKEWRAENTREQLKRRIRDLSKKHVIIDRQGIPVRFIEAILPETFLEDRITQSHDNYRESVGVSLLSAPEGLLWQVYDKTTRVFHQHEASLKFFYTWQGYQAHEAMEFLKDPEKYCLYLTNFNIKIKRKTQSSEVDLSVFLENRVRQSEMDDKLTVDWENSTLTLIDYSLGRTDSGNVARNCCINPPSKRNANASRTSTKIVVERFINGRYLVTSICRDRSIELIDSEAPPHYRDKTRTYTVERSTVENWLKTLLKQKEERDKKMVDSLVWAKCQLLEEFDIDPDHPPNLKRPAGIGFVFKFDSRNYRFIDQTSFKKVFNQSVYMGIKLKKPIQDMLGSVSWEMETKADHWRRSGDLISNVVSFDPMWGRDSKETELKLLSSIDQSSILMPIKINGEPSTRCLDLKGIILNEIKKIADEMKEHFDESQEKGRKYISEHGIEVGKTCIIS